MSACPDEANLGWTKFVDQKPVGFDVAFHVIGKPASERMVPVLVGEHVSLNQRGHHVFEFFDIFAALLGKL